MFPVSGIAIPPLKEIVPLVLLVIVSSFSKIIPVEPVTSMLVLNTPVVAVKAAAEFAPRIPSIAPINPVAVTLPVLGL